MVWSRLLDLVFGATSFAIATVLAAFMGGLALGAALGGRLAGRIRRPPLAYAALEGGIAVYGLLFPLLLGLLAPVNRLLWQGLASFSTLSAVRFVFVFALLVLPTAAMGATLPLLARWTAARRGGAGARVGALYAANTFGALIGCLAAGFLLLPTLGVTLTNVAAALCDLAAAGLVLQAARRRRPDALEAAPPAPRAPEDAEHAALLAELRPPLERTPDAGAARAVLLAYATAGLSGMAYEVLWSRALTIVAGSSVYAFTLVLAVYLGGHAAGAAAGTRLLRVWRDPMAALGRLLAATAILAAAAFLLVDRLPGWFLDWVRSTEPTAATVLGVQAAMMALVILPSATVGGAVFPLVIHLLAPGTPEGAGPDVARRVGHAYGFNTVGAIAGSVLTGFFVLPLLGLGPGMRLVAVLQLAVAAVVGLAALRVAVRPRLLPLVLPVAAALAVLAGPALRPERLAAGMFRVAITKDAFAHDEYIPADVVFYRDGLNATLTVERRDDHLALKANGKPEASNQDDMPSQILVGLVPLILHPAPKDVLLIGFGSGVTAGSILQDPRVERLVAVELEPAMVEASRWFEDVNHRPLDDPRLELVASDGRNYLAATDRSFDVIVSEPSNPWIAGVGSLFAVEHYEASRPHLRPGGIYMQWLQLYEMRPVNVRCVMRTFSGSFPHVWVLSTKPAGVDLMLMGSREPLPLDATVLAERWTLPKVAAEAARADVDSSWDLLGLVSLTPDELARYSAGAPLNTDDNARLEFSAPFDLARIEDEPWYAEFYFTGRFAQHPERFVTGLPPAPGPARTEALALLSRALVRSGRFDQAKRILEGLGEGAGGEPAAQARTVLRWLDEGPARVPVELGEGGSAEYRLMLRKVGEGWFSEALDAYADMPVAERFEDTNRVLLGYILLLEAREDEAEDVLTELAEQDGGALARRYPLILYLLGRAEYELARYRKAFDHLVEYDRLLGEAAVKAAVAPCVRCDALDVFGSSPP